jgi:hypothetical protein
MARNSADAGADAPCAVSLARLRAVAETLSNCLNDQSSGTCCWCAEPCVDGVTGLVCGAPSEGTHHAGCSSCLARSLHLRLTSPDDAADALRLGTQLRCPGLASGVQGCPTIFSPASLLACWSRSLSADQLSAALSDFSELQRLQTESACRRDVARELEEAAGRPLAQRIVDLCCRVGCPACDAPFGAGPDACMHATCTVCSFAFCGFCFAPQTTCRAEACAYNPVPGSTACTDKPRAFAVLKAVRLATMLRPHAAEARAQALAEPAVRDAMANAQLDPSLPHLVVDSEQQPYLSERVRHAIASAYRGADGSAAAPAPLADPVAFDVVGERVQPGSRVRLLGDLAQLRAMCVAAPRVGWADAMVPLVGATVTVLQVLADQCIVVPSRDQMDRWVLPPAAIVEHFPAAHARALREVQEVPAWMRVGGVVRILAGAQAACRAAGIAWNPAMTTLAGQSAVRVVAIDRELQRVHLEPRAGDDVAMWTLPWTAVRAATAAAQVQAAAADAAAEAALAVAEAALLAGPPRARVLPSARVLTAAAGIFFNEGAKLPFRNLFQLATDCLHKAMAPLLGEEVRVAQMDLISARALVHAPDGSGLWTLPLAAVQQVPLAEDYVPQEGDMPTWLGLGGDQMVRVGHDVRAQCVRAAIPFNPLMAPLAGATVRLMGFDAELGRMNVEAPATAGVPFWTLPIGAVRGPAKPRKARTEAAPAAADAAPAAAPRVASRKQPARGAAAEAEKEYGGEARKRTRRG